MKNPGWANNRGSPPYISRNSSYQIPLSPDAPAAMILKPRTACGDDDGSLSSLGLCSDLYVSWRVPTPYSKLQDPLQRLFGYVDFRGEILQGDLPDYTCLLGTLVQETYATHPDIRAACDKGMSSHIAELTRDVEAAKTLYAPKAQWSAESVGYFIQAVLQGGFIFAAV